MMEKRNVNIVVTIIIPNYNHALFLKQRIDSVLNQTFQDFELIILDDCSTDSSQEIIENYRNHPKISQIIYNDINSGGIFKQWVKGIENAKGAYIWIAESDDYAAENFLAETLYVMEQGASIGMVFTNNNVVDQHGTFLETSAESKAESYEQLATFQNTIDAENASQFLVSEMIIANASSVLFRKTSLLNINFTELEKFVNTGDRFVYLGIALNSKIKYLHQPLNYMRSHEHNTTKKSFENGNIHKDRLKVISYYFDQLYSASSAAKNVTAFYTANYLSFIHFGDYHDNIEVLKKLKQKKEIQNTFYQLVRFNLLLFKKVHFKSRILKGIYYRLLLLQK